jgi:hypothetical protein
MMAYISQGRKDERFEKLPSGIYRGKLIEMILKNSPERGDYMSLQWKLTMPKAYEGRSYWESFYLYHPDQKRAEKDQIHYETFLKQVGGIEKGQKDNPDLVLNKVCDLDIYLGNYEGQPYNKTNLWRLIPHSYDRERQAGVSLPQSSQSNFDEFNDDIPM